MLLWQTKSEITTKANSVFLSIHNLNFRLSLLIVFNITAFLIFATGRRRNLDHFLRVCGYRNRIH